MNDKTESEEVAGSVRAAALIVLAALTTLGLFAGVGVWALLSWR